MSLRDGKGLPMRIRKNAEGPPATSTFAFSWIWTMFGLMLRTEKSVMSVSMTVIFPLTFLSNVFVDPRTMPGWLQAFVNNSPITHLASAVRGLTAGDWPGVEIAWTLGWAGALLLVVGPVTMRLYNRKELRCQSRAGSGGVSRGGAGGRRAPHGWPASHARS